MPPLVSVLMTAYNREQYIAQAIESVLASTFQDFELIIVDDGSTDCTVEIARRYVSDSRVQVHINAKNLGDYPNRNRAAELAQGVYLKYVDSDDVIYPHGLAIMVSSMECFPEAGVGLCQSIDDKMMPYPLQISPREAYLEQFFKRGLFGNSPLSALIKADMFRIVGGFSGRRYVGDAELWLKLSARFPVVKLVAGLAWWRSHGDQEYWYAQKQFAYPPQYYQISLEALASEDCPLTREENQVARLKVKQAYARQLMALALHGDAQRAIRLYRDASLSMVDVWRGTRRVKMLS